MQSSNRFVPSIRIEVVDHLQSRRWICIAGTNAIIVWDLRYLTKSQLMIFSSVVFEETAAARALSIACWYPKSETAFDEFERIFGCQSAIEVALYKSRTWQTQSLSNKCTDSSSDISQSLCSRSKNLFR